MADSCLRAGAAAGLEDLYGSGEAGTSQMGQANVNPCEDLL